MTPEYDYSVFDIRQMNFSFSNMSEEEIAMRKKEAEERERAKMQSAKIEAVKTEIAQEKQEGAVTPPSSEKPTFKPKFKPIIKK
jgi:hypothetical protein